MGATNRLFRTPYFLISVLRVSQSNNELSIVGKPKINNSNVIDTLELARDKFPGSGISLDALCRRFRIDNSKREKHTALIDCELLTKVYINLTDQREPSLDFVSENQNSSNKNLQNTNIYSKKIIEPTSDELKLHKKYLKDHLKKNFFN